MQLLAKTTSPLLYPLQAVLQDRLPFSPFTGLLNAPHRGATRVAQPVQTFPGREFP